MLEAMLQRCYSSFKYMFCWLSFILMTLGFFGERLGVGVGFFDDECWLWLLKRLRGLLFMISRCNFR